MQPFRFGLLKLLPLLVVGSAAAKAMSQTQVAEGNHPKLWSAIVHKSENTANVTLGGTNLTSGRYTVSLGSKRLEATNTEKDVIIVDLPPALAAGTYFLVVRVEEAEPISVPIVVPDTGSKTTSITSVLPLMMAALIAIAGWFVVHRLNLKKDSESRRKDSNHKYLVDAYQAINKLIHDGIRSDADIASLRIALGNIHLFGSAELVTTASEAFRGFETGRSATIGPLFGALKSELRREIGLPPNSDSHGFAMGWDRHSEVANPQFESRNTRTTLLMTSYKQLIMHMSRKGANSDAEFLQAYEAIMNVWLVGSGKEVHLAHRFVQSGLSDGDVLIELLDELAKDIRLEVGLGTDSTPSPKIISWTPNI